MAPAPDAVLRADGLHKRYGGVHALRGVDLAIHGGEVHGLVGENGSGKSTALKVLAGQVAPDRGRIVLDGQEVRFADPTRALAAGIATVTQETTLVPDLSVAENIFLGRRKARTWRGIDWAATRARARAVLERLGLAIDPDRAAGSLPPNQQQMVEIARAISVDARVVILDEPTSSLADDEVEALFTVVRALRRDGVATLFVSHRLEEVYAIVDRVTVLRDGLVVGGGPLERYDRGELIRLMIGRDLEALTLGDGRHVVADPVLRVRDLHVAGGLGAPGVDLDVGRGEVVGLAGLVGAGRSEVFDALFGVQPPRSGRIEVDAAPVAPRSPRDAMRAGLGYVPADRKRLGVVLDMSVRENLLMASTASTPRLRRAVPGPEQVAVRRATAEFGIVAASPSTPVARLSGGNQQKVVLAKWLATEPRVLLLDEPTRGVDVGAKAEIYKLLQRAKEAGVGILISSSETPELRLLCDRILVMRRGRIVAALDREEATEAAIAHFAMGAA